MLVRLGLAIHRKVDTQKSRLLLVIECDALKHGRDLERDGRVDDKKDDKDERHRSTGTSG